MVSDVFPCEDGHAQERSLVGSVLQTVKRRDLWIADRNFCTRDVVTTIDGCEAFFVMREHRGLPCEVASPFRSCGRTPTGPVAQQRVCIVEKDGRTHVLRRLRVTLDHATRDGDTELYILTNLPRQVSAKRIAQLYQKRWKLETAFQHLEAYFHSEINTLGYPKAALFGFCLALVAYNLLAVVLAALRSVHGEDTVEQEVSLYYIANEISTTYQGMMIAIPEPEWGIFYTIPLGDLATILFDLAQRVRLRAFRKSYRKPKNPCLKWKKISRTGHISTIKFLRKRQESLVTP